MSNIKRMGAQAPLLKTQSVNQVMYLLTSLFDIDCRTAATIRDDLIDLTLLFDSYIV